MSRREIGASFVFAPSRARSTTTTFKANDDDNDCRVSKSVLVESIKAEFVLHELRLMKGGQHTVLLRR